MRFGFTFSSGGAPLLRSRNASSDRAAFRRSASTSSGFGLAAAFFFGGIAGSGRGEAAPSVTNALQGRTDEVLAKRAVDCRSDGEQGETCGYARRQALG